MYYFNYIRRANYYRNIKSKSRNLATYSQPGGGGGGGNGPTNYLIPVLIGLFFYASSRK